MTRAASTKRKVKGFFFWNNNIILLNNCNKTPKKATQGPHFDVF